VDEGHVRSRQQPGRQTDSSSSLAGPSVEEAFPVASADLRASQDSPY
jgi:hypothetical protein